MNDVEKTREYFAKLEAVTVPVVTDVLMRDKITNMSRAILRAMEGVK